MRALRFSSALICATAAAVAAVAAVGVEGGAAHLRVQLSLPSSQSPTTTGGLDGRMLLLLSADERTEPRFQVSDGDRTAQIFGVDVEGLRPGQDAVIDADVLGYPVQTLSDIKPGEYWVQGLMHVTRRSPDPTDTR